MKQTELKTTQGTFYLWFALDPYEKTLLGFAITQGRSILECLLVFLPLLVGSVVGALTKPLVVLTDGGTWYNVLDRLGVIWLVYKVLRSYIERFFQHYSQFLSMVVFIILSVVPVVLIPFMDPLTF